MLKEHVDPRVAVLIVWAAFFCVFIVVPAACVRCLCFCDADDDATLPPFEEHMEENERVRDSMGEMGFIRPDPGRFVFVNAAKRNEIDDLRAVMLRRVLGRFSVKLEEGHMVRRTGPGDEDGEEGDEGGKDGEEGEPLCAGLPDPQAAHGEDLASPDDYLPGCSPDDFMDEERGPGKEEEEEEKQEEKDPGLGKEKEEGEKQEENEEKKKKGDEKKRASSQNGTKNSTNYASETEIPKRKGELVQVSHPPGPLGMKLKIEGKRVTIESIPERHMMYGKMLPGDRFMSVNGKDINEMKRADIMEIEAGEEEYLFRNIILLRGGEEEEEEEGKGDGDSKEKTEEAKEEGECACPSDDYGNDSEYTHVRIPYPGYDRDGVRVTERDPDEGNEHWRVCLTTTLGDIHVPRPTAWLRTLRSRVRGTTAEGGAERDGEEPHDNDEEDPDEGEGDVELPEGVRRPEERREVPSSCAVCLAHFEPGDAITWSSSPDCVHVFHLDCVARWLGSVGRRTLDYRRDNVDLTRDSPGAAWRLLRYRLECPCCRQEFVARAVADHDDWLCNDFDEEEEEGGEGGERGGEENA